MFLNKLSVYLVYSYTVLHLIICLDKKALQLRQSIFNFNVIAIIAC